MFQTDPIGDDSKRKKTRETIITDAPPATLSVVIVEPEENAKIITDDAVYLASVCCRATRVQRHIPGGGTHNMCP